VRRLAMHRINIQGVAATAVVLVATFALPSSSAAQGSSNHHEVKNVIIMVADGMGLSNVTATRIRKHGIAGAPLTFETLEHIGYQRTFSEKNTVTDSSAAASTWACGEKFVNNEVCYHGDGRPYNPSLLELAKYAGWATGLVATQTITHATPAAFGAHLQKRTCETEIARQYVQETQPDVMLGGGVATFNPAVPDACGATGNYIVQAGSVGYRIVDTSAALAEAAASRRTSKLLGLFAPKNLTPEYLRMPGTTQPRLPEMTAAALAILERHKPGFFLMVEGSLIDSGNHAENIDYQYGETVAFDESVAVVRDWIAASPARRQHTLLIVLVDHETAGFAVMGTEAPGGEPLGYFYPGWTFTLKPEHPKDFEAHHTGGDVLIWSEGPGSEALGRAIDNTFVYTVVRDAIVR
jgi:alkaline phosphatase